MSTIVNKESRLELDAAKKSTAATTYDPDNSDVVNLKREMALRKKRDEIFALLLESDLKY